MAFDLRPIYFSKFSSDLAFANGEICMIELEINRAELIAIQSFMFALWNTQLSCIDKYVANTEKYSTKDVKISKMKLLHFLPTIIYGFGYIS